MIKVYIGTESAQWLPTQVLKYSATRQTKSEIEFHELKDIPLKLSAEMYTGFSFYRYSIPEVCGYEGKALYLDADIVVLSDLQALIDHPLHGKGALARPRPPVSSYTSVMLMDCAKLKHWKIHEWAILVNANIASYYGTMHGDPTGLNYRDFGPLEDYWNHLDYFDDTTRIIHYTSVPHQPWKAPGHPHAHVFLKELHRCLNEGVIKPADVEAQIDAGHVYPDLLKDMERIACP